MNELKSINLFFNRLRYNSGAIWIENESVMFSAPEQFQNQKTYDFISGNKKTISTILKLNQISSKEKYLGTIILKHNIVASYPLSPAQERLWFIEQFEEGTNAYHIPQIFELAITTDVEGLKYALQQMVLRHEVLRTTIEQPDNTEHGVQIVHDDIMPIEVITVKGNNNFESLIIEEINRPFNLSNEFPVRIKFYQIYLTGDASKDQPTRTVLLVNFHHIASDGWSIDIFQNELEIYYYEWVKGNRAFRMPELEIQYKDFALWQKTYLDGEILENQIKYWKEKLSGFQQLNFPVDYVRPVKVDYKGATQSFELNRELSNKLRNLCRHNGTTLHSVLLSNLSILLGKYTGQDDIITGSPTANRHMRQVEGLIGFFVNTQANRVLLRRNERFEELIKRVHMDQIEAQIHQDLPFEKLVNELGIERDTSRHPVFQVMFSVQNFGNKVKEKGKSDDYISICSINGAYEIEKFDLSFFIDDHLDYLKVRISYAASLFENETIERLATNFTRLLEQLTDTRDTPYSQISILSPDDYDKIINRWNDRDKYYPKDKTINQFFMEQALKTPENIALVYDGMQISYKELNEKSNQLARHIRTLYSERSGKELSPGTIIGICLDRCPEMVIGIMAILKSGGAYLPLDPGYPFERINYMLEDTDTRLILTRKQMIESNVKKLPLEKVVWIDLTEQLYNSNSKSDLLFYSKPEDLIYVIYTSGTTGNPKGVMVEHSAVASLVYNDFIEISENDVFAFFSAQVFDAATFELWMPLLNGNALVIPKNLNDIIDDALIFKQFLTANKISIVLLTTTLFESLYCSDDSIFNSLKFLLTGGEALDKNTVNKLLSNENKPWQFINGYGPTESTTFATAYRFTNPVISVNVPIGKPICNRKVYVLDSSLAPVPIGVKGELFISGTGLARGYVNCPELTAERFIENPFTTPDDDIPGNNRLYRTGDLVRWLPDGNLEFLGRNDGQVKIRGFRIELGEIEHALGQINGIMQSCVLVKEINTESGNNKYLAGYYVPAATDSKITRAAIFEQLFAFLPGYMIPEILIEMEEFPLTVNGKLDRKALPVPDFSSFLYDYIPPGTETESDVCRIWQKVLGLDRVGITDDFFKIGGNSILAIQVAHRISKIPGLHVKISDIFKYKSISGLLLNNSGRTCINIPKTNLTKAALSFAQERLWFIEQYEPGTTAYNIPALFELDKDTNVNGVKYALHQIVSRHEVLRTTIEQQHGMKYGMQIVHDSSISIEEITVRDKASLDSLLRKEMVRPFNLSNDFPIRVTLYHIDSCDLLADSTRAKNILLVNMHHIASDGWSVDIFLRDFNSYYEAFIEGITSFRLPELEIQYIDYAVWQKSYLTGEILEKQLAYWKTKLTGFQPLVLSTDFHRPAAIDYRGANQSFAISKKISEKLRVLARHHGVTLNSVLLSSVNILLGKYTGQEDIVTGSPIANRHHRQTEDLIGFFVNTQVNRTILNRNQNFHDLIKQVHQEQSEAQAYQDLPFEKLLDESGVERDPSRHPVFQIMFGLLNFGKASQVTDSSKMILRPYHLEEAFNVEKFDLSIFIDDSQEELCVQFSYATSLYHQDTILRIRNHYSHLLGQLAKAPEIPYSQIGLLNTEEYNRTVIEWNDTCKSYPNNKTIHELFAEQVFRTPVNIALVYEGQQLTYRELNEKSNQLARYIRGRYRQRTNQEMAPDTLIALYLNRSPELFAGILAVLKAGGAYVPIDTNYPQERIDFILEDTGAELILSQASLWEATNILLPENRLVDISLSESLYNTEETTALEQHSRSGDLAYVIYTSGTTGKPKGVMVNHSGIINRLVWMQAAYPLSEADVVLQKTPYVFDVSVWEIFWANWYGAKIVIAKPEGHKDSEYLHGLIREYQVTTVHFVPSMLEAYNHYLSETKTGFSNSLRQIFCSGEALNKTAVHQAYSNASNESFRLHNLYGPTEASVDVTYFETAPGKSVYIGKPIQNTQVYVLDTLGNPVPIGVAGELYLGGAGIARGYLNRSELTLERFIINPFATENDKEKGYRRLYKTGDIVRWTPDGNLEYLGRNDNQVKIRGFRIELGEIEHALLQIPGILQSCVLVKDRYRESGTNKYIVAYCVLADTGTGPAEATIRKILSGVLPDYMVPVAFVLLSAMPLTINGKLDKSALQEPALVLNQSEYEAPSGDVEILLSRILQGVLGLEHIGACDDFFRIGGDSILSIQVSSQIRQAGFKIQVRDIFEYRTIRNIAAQLIARTTDSNIKTEQGVLTGRFGLLPVQQWFAEQVETGVMGAPGHWNQNFLIKIPVLDTVKLALVLDALIEYHDVLRLRFIRESSATHEGINWEQVYEPVTGAYQFKTLDISELSAENVQDILTGWQSGFQLESGPNFQIGYLHGYEDGSARLFLALHHLIVDSVSWRILTEDIMTLYAGKELPSKGSSYRQWVTTVRSYAVYNMAEKTYWMGQVKNVPKDPLAELRQESASAFFELDRAVTKSLLQEASKAHQTEINDLLLTALAYALKEINGQDVQGIMLEGHGREDIDPAMDTSHTVGWFTTMFPVKLELQDNLKMSIEFIKESIRNIPAKGIGFGVFATDTNSGFTYDDLPGISFNYLGQFDAPEGYWQILPGGGNSSSPLNRDRNYININGIVRNGELMFSVVTRLGTEKTDRLAEGFKKQLMRIVSYCEQQYLVHETGFTPSDFKDFIPYEIINGHLDEELVFILPPGGGGAESYYDNIVPGLKNRKIVLFNNYFYYLRKNNKKIDEYSIEELSMYYRLLVRYLQPAGKYTIMGWSFGGLLALEISMQLADKGAEINKLILLDSFFNLKDADKYIPHKFVDHSRSTINYKYERQFPAVGFEIVLFKAIKDFNDFEIAVDIEDYEKEVFKGYVKHFLETQYNGLDKLFVDGLNQVKDHIVVVDVETHHNNVPYAIAGDIINYV